MDPQAQAVLDRLAALAPTVPANADDTIWLAGFRAQTALLPGFSGAPEPVVRVEHRQVPAGGRNLILRLYRPAEGRLPLLLYMHGGGAIAGSVDGHDAPLRALANRTGWLVAAPEYRLAPEAKFPAQIDEGWTALSWVAHHASEIGTDPSRIVVAGDSIGGTMAIALAMRARGKERPRPAGQVLLYPNTDLRRGADYASHRENDGRIIKMADLERQIALYVRTEADRLSPAASPVAAKDLSGLPPTLMVTGGADPLGDEGKELAERLAAAGVSVDHRRFDGMIHAFLQMGGSVDATRALISQVADWLKQFN